MGLVGARAVWGVNIFGEDRRFGDPGLNDGDTNIERRKFLSKTFTHCFKGPL